jgi:AraC family transcriptional regulator
MADFRFKLNPPAPEIGTCSTLLNGVATRYQVNRYRTTLSLKAVVRGAALYRTPQAQHLVTEDCFLILNDGQEYSLDFKWPEVTETLCLFFQPGFMENVSHCLSASTSKQLDDFDAAARGVEFCECLCPRSGRLGGLLRQLHAGVNAGRAVGTWLEDQFYELAESVVQLNANVPRSIENVAALRIGTREELYRRLHRGRDYLSSCYDAPVTVASAARAAKLSPAHFHRHFKALFHQTPMQFLQARRLAAACRLLVSTDQPITNICLLVGFESLSSFSSLFRKRFGISPSQYRKLQAGEN